ncbi:MAG: hypothetical protein ABI390_03080 [Daejeonella sp.]
MAQTLGLPAYIPYAMKNVLLAFAFIILILPFSKVEAQEKVKINIEKQPLWGPVGFDHVDYYYIPGIQTYYSVDKRQFIYLSNGRWIFSKHLPQKSISFDLYEAHKVVLNGTSRPYLQFNEHKEKYDNLKTKKSKQICIKDSKNRKYHSNSNKKVIQKKTIQPVKKGVKPIHKTPVKPVIKLKPKVKVKSFSH